MPCEFTRPRRTGPPNSVNVQVRIVMYARMAVTGNAGTMAGPASSVTLTRNVNAYRGSLDEVEAYRVQTKDLFFFIRLVAAIGWSVLVGRQTDLS